MGQRLEQRGADDAESRQEETDADDAQSRYADFEHVVRSVEDHQKLLRDSLK